MKFDVKFGKSLLPRALEANLRVKVILLLRSYSIFPTKSVLKLREKMKKTLWGIFISIFCHLEIENWTFRKTIRQTKIFVAFSDSKSLKFIFRKNRNFLINFQSDLLHKNIAQRQNIPKPIIMY